jgi:hypothetical protein
MRVWIGDNGGHGEGEITIYNQPVEEPDDYDIQGRTLPMRAVKQISRAIENGQEDGKVLQKIEWRLEER